MAHAFSTDLLKSKSHFLRDEINLNECTLLELKEKIKIKYPNETIFMNENKVNESVTNVELCVRFVKQALFGREYVKCYTYNLNFDSKTGKQLIDSLSDQGQNNSKKEDEKEIIENRQLSKIRQFSNIIQELKEICDNVIKIWKKFIEIQNLESKILTNIIYLYEYDNNCSVEIVKMIKKCEEKILDWMKLHEENKQVLNEIEISEDELKILHKEINKNSTEILDDIENMIETITVSLKEQTEKQFSRKNRIINDAILSGELVDLDYVIVSYESTNKMENNKKEEFNQVDELKTQSGSKYEIENNVKLPNSELNSSEDKQQKVNLEEKIKIVELKKKLYDIKVKKHMQNLKETKSKLEDKMELTKKEFEKWEQTNKTDEEERLIEVGKMANLLSGLAKMQNITLEQQFKPIKGHQHEGKPKEMSEEKSKHIKRDMKKEKEAYKELHQFEKESNNEGKIFNIKNLFGK